MRILLTTSISVFVLLLHFGCRKELDHKLEGHWSMIWQMGIDSSMINNGVFYKTGINFEFYTQSEFTVVSFTEEITTTPSYSVDWGEKKLKFYDCEEDWLLGEWDIEYWNESIPNGANDDHMILSIIENQDTLREIHLWRSKPPKGHVRY